MLKRCSVIAKVSMSELKESVRTKTRVLIYIMAVWAFSAFISIPPLLGWKKDLDMSWFDQQKQYQQVGKSWMVPAYIRLQKCFDVGWVGVRLNGRISLTQL